MGKIFRDMTAEEQAYYDEDSKKFPWLKTITMSDDEFLACYERDTMNSWHVMSVILEREWLPYAFIAFGTSITAGFALLS